MQIQLPALLASTEPFTLSYHVRIAPVLSTTAAISTTLDLVNQAWIQSVALPPLLTNDPATVAPMDATRLAVTPLGAYYPCMGIPDSECAALQALYVSTNGALWTNHSGWFVSNEPCTWYGISCRQDGDGRLHVTALDLAHNQLQGTIPATLALLSQLERLDLADNALNGIIPPSIGELANLTALNLSENQLVGALPTELGQLAALRTLYLFDNNFSGDLPATLVNLTQLEKLYYQSTQLCPTQDTALLIWLETVATLAGTSSADCRYVDDTAKPLVLIYAGLDNNLSGEWGRLVNNIEKGTRDDDFTVKLLIDAFGDNNSYEFLIKQDNDITCPSLVTGFLECGRYRLGSTLRTQVEDTAQRDLLTTFIINALYEHPNATQVILSVVGHGAGWGANALPAQPRGWTEQNGTFTDIAGGMLWDDTAGAGAPASRSLSTKALGEALRQVKAITGRSIDLLYLDACSMAMVEVAYEVRDSVNFLLASENTKWATFPYDELLPAVAGGLDAKTLGERWLDTETALLRRVPGWTSPSR
ncbi:MAG: clostripain-related cysteine peptidase [Caldilineaceae bacterium]